VTEKPKSKSFSWPFWLLLIGSVSLFYFLGKPNYVGGNDRKRPEQSQAVSNLRQVGLALFEFDSEYSSFPTESTVAKVTAKHPDHGLDLSGKSSNAFFRQLFAAKLTQSEQMFYAQVAGTKRPDGDVSAGKVLSPGEVVFGYVTGLSTNGNPARPVAFCPIIPGTDRFDPIPFDGKAVILRIDNSVASLNIDKDGHANIGGGKTLFDPDNALWEGKIPDVRYPEGLSTSKPSFFQKVFSK